MAEGPNIEDLLARLDAEPGDPDTTEQVFAAIHGELSQRAQRRIMGANASWSASRATAR